MQRSPLIKGIALLAIIFITTVGLTFLLKDTYLLNLLVDTIRAAPLFILLKVATIVFAPLSGSVLYIIAPVLWPSWLAVIYVSIGNIVGISIAYRLGYRYGDKAITWFLGEHTLAQAHGIVDKIRGYRNFLAVRVILFPLEDMINFVAGIARVPFWWFLVVSMTITTGLFGLFVMGFVWIEKLL